ncbi:het domain protein [Diplodia corticola]|uniref:Het domain protein n=1 Tax=Diplodia corticola TaxID=236234 RepID=A0A1J9SGK9_9PEZI|nr:het domain protein [Diplodia corticola]OJD38717.1 het domain protein [Diplodia corticola]
MDHFESLGPFRYGEAPLRPIRWLGYDHESHPPCDFRDYLLSRGWSFSAQERLRSKPVDEDFISGTLPMVQSWLFIGALESMAKRRIPAEDFIRTRLNRPHVSTRIVAPLLENWEDSVEELALPEREALNDELGDILSEIQFWCFKLASSTVTPDDPKAVLSTPTEIDATCRLLTLIGEAINTARTYLHTPALPNAKGFAGAYTPLEGRRLVSRLVKVGWCPFMARMLVTYRYSVAEYASFWSKKEPRYGRRHSRCSPAQCVAYDVDTSTYRPRHDAPGCDCGHVVPCVGQMKELLDNGRIPVLTIAPQSGTATENIRLDVSDAAAFQDSGGYAAFSHVWSDGIGSTSEAGLPSCVIKNLFNQARAYGRICIWIDSLCVPADPGVREKAIRLMAATYRRAAITLVLDSQIRRIDRTHAAPARHVAMDAAPLDPPRGGALAIPRLPVPKHHGHGGGPALGNELLRLLRSSSVLAGVPEESKALELGHVCRMLRVRTTSKARDEAVVIAGLLNVDVGPILESRVPEDRMRRLLVLLKRVPSDIVFSSRRRMLDHGFRWAPQSFLMDGSTVADRWSLTTGARAQWADVLEEGGLRGRYAVTRLEKTVTVERECALVIRAEGKLAKITGLDMADDSDGCVVRFDSFAVLPHLGSYSDMKLAAALLRRETGRGEVFEYRGRILVGDFDVYMGSGEGRREVVEATVHSSEGYAEITVV